MVGLSSEEETSSTSTRVENPWKNRKGLVSRGFLPVLDTNGCLFFDITADCDPLARFVSSNAGLARGRSSVIGIGPVSVVSECGSIRPRPSTTERVSSDEDRSSLSDLSDESVLSVILRSSELSSSVGTVEGLVDPRSSFSEELVALSLDTRPSWLAAVR